MPNIHHELFIAVPSEKIYDALTSEAGLCAWWTPNTITNGKTHSLARFTFGNGYFKEMKVEELKYPEYIKWTCVAAAAEWIGTSISFKLESGVKQTLLNEHPEIADQLQQNVSENNGTLLTLRHEGWKDYTPMFAECNYTWGQFLRSLKLFCETGKGRPWPSQHKNDCYQ